MIFENLAPISEQYDAFFIDVFGVIFDGSKICNGVLELMKELKSAGKTLIILSNTTLVADACKEKYQALGLKKSVHYDTFVSSGEAFCQTLHEHIHGAETYFQAVSRNDEIFRNSGLREVNTIPDADFVYVGSLYTGKRLFPLRDLKTKSGVPIAMDDITSFDCHDIAGMDELAHLLDECLRFEKTLVIVNPDLFAIDTVGSEQIPLLCSGAVGEFYEKMGGKVVYFGKPYPATYDYAKKFIQHNAKVAMIGDTPWTDILGGNTAGIDTSLTLTGVSGEFIKTMDDDLSLTEKVEKLINEISPKMVHRDLKKFSQSPKHIIKRFA